MSLKLSASVVGLAILGTGLVGAMIVVVAYEGNAPTSKALNEAESVVPHYNPPSMETFKYEGHLFIRQPRIPEAGFIHHPSCPCLHPQHEVEAPKARITF